MTHKYLLIIILFLAGAAKAEHFACFNVKREFSTVEFYKHVFQYIDCSKKMDASAIDLLPDSSYSILKKGYTGVPLKNQDCYYWVKFKLCNSSATDQSVVFTSGSVATFSVFKKLIDGRFEKLTGIKNNHILLHIDAGDTIEYFVQHSFHLAGTRQYFYPYIVDLSTIVERSSQNYLSSDRGAFFYFQVLFCGMAGMLGIYLLIGFFNIYDRSYLYYSLNILSVVALVAIRLLYTGAPSENSYSVQSLLVPVLQVLSHLFYFLFAVYFLNLKELLPRLAKFFNYTITFLVVYIITDFFLFVGGDNIVIRMQLFFWVRIALIVVAVGSIIYASRKKPSILLRLFTAGTFLMVISATVSFVLSYKLSNSDYGFFSIPFFYFLLGVLIDNLFFTICLGYKNRLEQQNKLALERELFMQRARERETRLKLIMDTQEQERNRMAEDLHDDLGSGLSTIRFFIESMKLKGESIQSRDLNFISSKTAEIIENMRQIIWAVNPEHDNLADLLFYMKRYCGEYLETNKVDWDFIMPEQVEDRVLPAGLRRNLFAILKEALHNTVKHSGADKVEVVFNSYRHHSGILTCKLSIIDNGKGFDTNANSEGNGVKNMYRRMKETGSTLNIHSDEGGTSIELSFNIP